MLSKNFSMAIQEVIVSKLKFPLNKYREQGNLKIYSLEIERHYLTLRFVREMYFYNFE